MALNDKYDSTVRDLKATFFDIFYDHIGEMTKMIESIANDEVNDPVRVETAIFQRILLLNKSAGSVKSISEDVENLNLSRGDGFEEIIPKKKSVAPVKAPVQNSTPVRQNDVPTTQPAVVNTPVAKPVEVANVPAPKPVDVVNKPVVSSVPPTKAPVVSTPVTSAPVAEVKPASVAPTTVAPATVTPMTSAPVTVAPVVSTPTPVKTEVSSEDRTAKFRFIKTDSTKVKAILVNEKQYNRLKASFLHQAKSVGTMINSEHHPASKEQIELLMRRASALYKEGKVKEAQALYSQISSMNKELNKQQGGNQLIKRAS